MTAEELAVNLHSTMDAKVWTDEYIKDNGGDWGLMMEWFSNAIMVGYDFATRKQNDRIEKLERVRTAAKNFMHERSNERDYYALFTALDACEVAE